MLRFLLLWLGAVLRLFRSRRDLFVENLALPQNSENGALNLDENAEAQESARNGQSWKVALFAAPQRWRPFAMQVAFRRVCQRLQQTNPLSSFVPPVVC